MSANKYANLPDIDTAQDVYETEDLFQPSETNKDDSSDEETSVPTRSGVRGRNGDSSYGTEELDSSSLIGADVAMKKFQKAEKRRDRLRTHYAHPESPTSPTTPTATKQPLTLSARLRFLQTELGALEIELADPSNPLLAKEREEDNVDPGELIRGLVDVKARLGKISKGKEGRGKLVEALLSEADGAVSSREQFLIKERLLTKKGEKGSENIAAPDVRSIAELDKRVGELETLVGSSTTALDETSPLPPPLLPLILRLNNQLQILTQPRHIDSISRRLKLLISDLDRASAAQHHSHRRPPSNAQQQPQVQVPGTTPSALQDQLLPLITRLVPSLPQIPHILTRLRTLSTLHTSAAEFQNTLEGLEEEQRQMREALRELGDAVDKVEMSLEENRKLVKRNVEGLEGRVEALLGRVEKVGR